MRKVSNGSCLTPQGILYKKFQGGNQHFLCTSREGQSHFGGAGQIAPLPPCPLAPPPPQKTCTESVSSEGLSFLCVVDTGVEMGTPCKNNGCETVSISVFCLQ